MSPFTSFRLASGLSQAQIGTLLGRSRSTVASYESGGPVDPACAALLEVLRTKTRPQLLAMLDSKVEASRQSNDAQHELLDLLLSDQAVSRMVQHGPLGSEFWVRERGGLSRRIPLSTVERAMSTDQNLGGELVGQRLLPPVGTIAAASALTRLGARYIPSPTPQAGNLVAPYLTSTPKPQWLAEGQSLTSADAATAASSTAFKTLGVRVDVTRRLMQQASSGVSLVFRELMKSLARECDLAAIDGAGGVAPTGILSDPGVHAVAGPLTLSTWREAVESLETGGVDTELLGVVASPATKTRACAVENNRGPLWVVRDGLQWLDGLPATLSAAAGPTLLVGDFSQLAVYHSPEIELKLVDGQDPTGRLSAYVFWDVAVLLPRPETMVRIDNA